VGDYFAGPNHVLPTGGTARFASALGVSVFLRRQSVLRYSAERLRQSGEAIARFAEAEGLDAHALAVRVRMRGSGFKVQGSQELGIEEGEGVTRSSRHASLETATEQPRLAQSSIDTNPEP
jgi:hypothetical protein